MGIFNLNNEQAEPKVDAELQPEKSGVTEVQGTRQEVDSANGSSKDPVNPDELKNATIVLDGPLSHVYTQALNLVYAKEDTDSMVAMVMDQNASATEVDEKDLYVYAVDGDSLDHTGLVDGMDKLRLALDSKAYKQVALAVECRTGVNGKVGLLEQFAAQAGVKVFVSRRSALEGFGVAVESLHKR